MSSIQSTHLSAHLNDDQFTECLMGVAPDSEAAAHLAQCEGCRAELERFGVSVNSFNRVALEWSEARPVASLREASRAGGGRTFGVHRPFFATASWALATCLAVGVGVSVVLRHEQNMRGANVASGIPVQENVAQGDSPEQI